MREDFDFEAFFNMHERRIHYQIQRLGIRGDAYQEFYSEGIYALWLAYKKYEQEKGNIGTFLNYQIRFRLIDLVRKKARYQEVSEEAVHERTVEIDDGNRYSTSRFPLVSMTSLPLSNDAFWDEVKRHLSDRQWKWVQYYIIAELTVKEIAEIEGVSASAVKSWGSEVRRKLRDDVVRERLRGMV